MGKTLLIAAAAGLSILIPAARGAEPAPVAYIDAHSHLDPATPDDEIALFRKAGLAGVVMMSQNPTALADIIKRNPGYVAGGIMVGRTKTETDGFRLNADTGAGFAKLYDTGQVCQFGEIPTRIEGEPDANDAAAISNSFRAKIYDAANARGIPVNTHVSLETPEVIAAVEQAAASHPNMKYIIAHAGWVAGPDLIGRMMAAHPNIYADLSIRMLPPRPGGGGNSNLSILTPQGALQPEWSALILRFPDRFMFGMDVSGKDAQARIPQTLAAAKTAFAPLPRTVQEQVAHGNIQRLLKGCGLKAIAAR